MFKIAIDNKRVYGLDILRAFAILFVVIGHGNKLLPQKIAGNIYSFLLDGVGLFFVLSGFLIGGILLRTLEKEGKSTRLLFNFWIRRWFRTLPNYFLILIILSLLYLFFKDGFALADIARYFVFSQNLFYHHGVWFFPEAWSLSVEEWFYLLAPVLIFGSAYVFRIKNAFLFTATGIILAITLFRFYRYTTITIHNAIDWDIFFRTQVATRVDSLMYGMVGAYLLFYYKRSWIKYKRTLFFIGILLLVTSKFFEPILSAKPGLYYCVFSFSINSLATLLLLPLLSELKQGKGFVFTTITYLSLVSYSMYLLNFTIVQGWILNKIDFSSLMPYDTIVKYLLYWLLTISLSIMLYKYYELPMMKLRDKIK
jgi:peptidoglycan/LPS O-acetylase OafA/YrhL